MSSKSGVTVIVAGEDKTGEVFAAVQKHLQQVREGAKETSISLEDVGGALRGALGVAGISVGIAQLVGGLKQMITTSMESAVQIGKMNQQTGISAENLSTLKYAAQASGVEFETVAKSGKKLAEAIHETDAGKLSEGFKMLGISAAEVKSKGQDMWGVMELIANKFQEMPDGPEKLSASVKLFGRAGQEMIPILNQGAAALEDYKRQAPIFSDADIENAEKLHRATLDLNTAELNLTKSITGALAPAMSGYLNDTAEGLDLISEKAHDALGWLSRISEHVLTDKGRSALGLPSLTEWTPLDWGQNGPPKKQPSPTDPEASKKLMLADRTSLAEQKENHAMSIAEELAFWQKKIGAFSRGSEQYLEALNEINRLTKEAATKAATAEKQALDTFIGESVSAARDAASENDRISEEVTRAWQDGLKEQSLQATETTQAAVAQDAATAKIAAATVEHERLSKSINESGAAQKLAAIHAQQYAADIAALTDLLERLRQVAAAGGDVGKEVSATEDKIIALRGDAAADAIVSAPIKQTNNMVGDEAEKFAHGVFDPLFNFGEKWSKQWEQIRKNMLRDLGQTAESALFGALFGDPSGRGGKGWNGGSFKGDTSNPRGGRSGLASEALGGLMGMFSHKAPATTSNGGVGSGAGTVASAAASIMQTGKGVGNAGIQVILNNQGPAMQVDQTQQSGGDGGEAQVVQIVLKQLSTNGPIATGITSMLGMF